MVYVYLFFLNLNIIDVKKLLTISLLFSIICSYTLNAQKINQLDLGGNRDGVWRKFYKNGRIRYEGTFRNGKEVGTFKFYSVASSFYPVIVKEFSETSNQAKVKFYTLKGKLNSEGLMVGKNRIGKWLYYFSDGKVSSEESYANGKLNGLSKDYYRNGKVTIEVQYSNGEKNGFSKTYTEDGVLIEHVNYSNGKLNGSAQYFDLKGNLKEKGTYQDNKRVGKWDYYMDGELSNKRKRKAHRIKK